MKEMSLIDTCGEKVEHYARVVVACLHDLEKWRKVPIMDLDMDLNDGSSALSCLRKDSFIASLDRCFAVDTNMIEGRKTNVIDY